MQDMTQIQKQEKIKSLRQQKEKLFPEIVDLNKEYQKLRQIFFQKEQAYLDLRKKYESLDREEKLLIFDKPLKTKTVKKDNTSNHTKAKNAAIKALDTLPPALREQILKNFKKE